MPSTLYLVCTFFFYSWPFFITRCFMSDECQGVSCRVVACHGVACHGMSFMLYLLPCCCHRCRRRGKISDVFQRLFAIVVISVSSIPFFSFPFPSPRRRPHSASYRITPLYPGSPHPLLLLSFHDPSTRLPISSSSCSSSPAPRTDRT